MSVLLRQPNGFEGLCRVSVHLHANRGPTSDGPDLTRTSPRWPQIPWSALAAKRSPRRGRRPRPAGALPAVPNRRSSPTTSARNSEHPLSAVVDRALRPAAKVDMSQAKSGGSMSATGWWVSSKRSYSRRTISTFSCDIAYPRCSASRSAAARAWSTSEVVRRAIEPPTQR